MQIKHKTKKYTNIIIFVTKCVINMFEALQKMDGAN